jgi:hypothetical protein
MGEKRGADVKPLIPVVEGSTPEIAHPFRLALLLARFVWLLFCWQDYPAAVARDGGTEQNLSNVV